MLKKIWNIIVDGAVLAVPIAVVLYVGWKVLGVFKKAIQPMAEKLGIDSVFGTLTITLLALLVILLVVMVLGLAMRIRAVSRLGDRMEEIVLRFVPSLNQVKVMVGARRDREKMTSFWKPVILHHEEKYHFAFLIEESDQAAAFFVLNGYTVNDGETEILARGNYAYREVEAGVLRRAVMSYGKGATAVIGKLFGGQ